MGRWKPRGAAPVERATPVAAPSDWPAPIKGDAIPYADRDPARCFRGACYIPLPPDGGWFNRGTGKHYCERCARLINRYNPDAVPPLCSPPENPSPNHVDDFGGIHCPACRTVHGEGDVCPHCGVAVRLAPEDAYLAR